MRGTTIKRRMGGEDAARLVAKQARRERLAYRLAYRLVERRLRWQARQARTTVGLGGEG